MAVVRLVLALAVTPVLLGACSTLDDTAQDILASRASAAGVVAGRLLQGKAIFNRPRAGNIHLHSSDAPSLDCAGTLTMTATHSGVANLSCNDGQTVLVPFQLLGPMRATGRGRMGDAVFSLTYGLPPDMAGPYLGVPAGRLMSPAAETAKPTVAKEQVPPT
ncbi:MAG: hypothetical protein LH632_00450 [Rhodoferax sp.]|nr:hypothetical protein [Rhodoferax sp.]